MLTPPPYSIHVSIISQCVTVRHPTALSPLAIREAIQDAGFDIADPAGASHIRLSDTLDSPSPSRKAADHVEQCQFCQNELKSALETDKIAELSTPQNKSPQFHSSQVRLPQEVAINGTDCSDDVPHRLALTVGGMTCASCANAVTQALSQIPGVRDVSVSLLDDSAIAVLDVKANIGDALEAINGIGYKAEVASVQPLISKITAIKMDGPLRLTLSVGGMTCAACSSTITQLLSEEEGVTDVSVNLMGNSATLVVKSKELIMGVKEVIESAGYEASVVGAEPLQVTPDSVEVVHGQRTVALRIEGMFCE